jgi:hypothetical protein
MYSSIVSQLHGDDEMMGYIYRAVTLANNNTVMCSVFSGCSAAAGEFFRFVHVLWSDDDQ